MEEFNEWYNDLDPVSKAYMFEQWCQDRHDHHELGKMVAIITGSFINPEQAKNMAKDPEYVTDDEEFEKLSERIKQHNQNEPIKRRPRRKIVNK